MNIKRTILSCVALAMSLCGTASASTIALTFTGGTGANIFQGVMAGWRFHTNNQIAVDALGVYDLNGAGLAGNRQVGIWDSGGNLLGSAVVPANGGTLINSFRFASIVPIDLAANQLFTIAVFYPTQGDTIITSDAIVTTDGSINFVDRATSATNSFSMPINFNSLNLAGDFGPSFTIVRGAAAAPEPASLVFLGIGLALIAAGRKYLAR